MYLTIISMLLITNVLFAMHGTIHPKTTAGKFAGFAILFTVFPALFACLGLFVALVDKAGSTFVPLNAWVLLVGAGVTTLVVIGLCGLSVWASDTLDKRA